MLSTKGERAKRKMPPRAARPPPHSSASDVVRPEHITGQNVDLRIWRREPAPVGRGHIRGGSLPPCRSIAAWGMSKRRGLRGGHDQKLAKRRQTDWFMVVFERIVTFAVSLTPSH